MTRGARQVKELEGHGAVLQQRLGAAEDEASELRARLGSDGAAWAAERAAALVRERGLEAEVRAGATALAEARASEALLEKELQALRARADVSASDYAATQVELKRLRECSEVLTRPAAAAMRAAGANQGMVSKGVARVRVQG
jgi:hypothetical protein